MEPDNPTDIRRAAMDLLARREHGRVELARKLKRKGADDAVVDKVLDQLAEDRLLDESRYLESYIASRSRTGHGPARIREELSQRGIDRTAIGQALAECGIDWQDVLVDLWQRKFGEVATDPKEKAKQVRFLLYRGFAMDDVTRLLRKPPRC